MRSPAGTTATVRTGVRRARSANQPTARLGVVRLGRFLTGMTESEQSEVLKSDSRGATPSDASVVLESWVVSLLACPVDRGAVRLDGSELVCNRCGRRYSVRGGIPQMVPEQAKTEQEF